MAKSKGKKKIVFGILLLLAIGAWVAYAKFGKRVPPISVTDEKVARRNLTEEVTANGKIEPVLEVKISPEVSGEITDLEVKEGQHIKKGDLLLKIRPDNYVAARDSSKANYELAIDNRDTAEANLEKARLEYERNQALHQANLISDSDFLTAKNNYDVAKSGLDGAAEQVTMAQAQLKSAEVDLSKTVIYSPISGTVSKLISRQGERVVGTATMAGTEIMDIADLTNMEARVDIGEMDIPLIGLCQKAHLEIDSFKDKKFNGLVTDIGKSANNNDTSSPSSTTGSTDATKFQIKVRLAEHEDFLPGMSVTANIETRYRTNVLCVPILAVTTRMPTNSASTNKVIAAGTNAVATTNATTATNLAAADPPDPGKKNDEPPKPIEVVFIVDGDHVKMVPVKCGIEDANYIEILNGLKEGDQVVSGSYKAINRELADGTKITVSNSVAQVKIVAN